MQPNLSNNNLPKTTGLLNTNSPENTSLEIPPTTSSLAKKILSLHNSASID